MANCIPARTSPACSILSRQNPQPANPMNEPEIKSPQPQGDLSAQVAALQRQVFTLLLVLLVVSATLAAYLRYEDYISTRMPPSSDRRRCRSSTHSARQRRNQPASLAGFSQTIGRLWPEEPRFRAAGVEKIRLHAAPGDDASRRHRAGQASRRRARRAEEAIIHFYATFTPQFGQKFDCGGIFFPQPAQSECAALLRR